MEISLRPVYEPARDRHSYERGPGGPERLRAIFPLTHLLVLPRLPTHHLTQLVWLMHVGCPSKLPGVLEIGERRRNRLNVASPVMALLRRVGDRGGRPARRRDVNHGGGTGRAAARLPPRAARCPPRRRRDGWPFGEARGTSPPSTPTGLHRCRRLRRNRRVEYECISEARRPVRPACSLGTLS